jgi:hypothetical protein
MFSTGEQIRSIDPENAVGGTQPAVSASAPIENSSRNVDATLDFGEVITSDNKWLVLSSRIEHLLGFEARGIHRVKPNEQTAETTLSFLQIFVLWFSINTAAQNITLASIGQGVYNLGFLDATLCSILGAILGSIPVAYTAGWGALSGNRTMVSCLRPRDSKADLPRIDMCPFFYGLVASEAVHSVESSCHARVRHY